MAIISLPGTFVPGAVAGFRQTLGCDYYPGASAFAAGQAPCSLFCLAPQKVYRAPDLTIRAVGSYPAFSPLPEMRERTPGGLFSVTLSVDPSFRRERPRLFRGLLPVWCPDFPLAG